MGDILGAIIAGGQSSRFGADKALARVAGRTLLEHAIAALTPQVDALVLCGRSSPGVPMVTDLPEAGLGPLGGLNAALHHAASLGLSAVLSAPVDVMPLPPDLARRLGGDGPRFLCGQYLIGLWPVALAEALNAHIAAGNRSMRSWIEACEAVAVDDADLNLRNINRPGDLPPMASNPSPQSHP